MHWHGILLPNGMDGVGGLTQAPIQPGETFKYEFTVWQHGTFMYHSHHDEMTQMALGMLGMFVVHPREPTGPAPDRDFVFMLSEWKIKPGTTRPDPNEMTDFNVLTFNGRAFPGTAPLVAKLGDRVRIRIGNLSRDGSSPDPPSRPCLAGSSRPTADRSPKSLSGRRRRSSCRWAPHGRSSSSPTTRAIGRCTAT